MASSRITSGGHHTCWLTVQGEIGCDGEDTHGQSSPSEGTNFVDIAAGEDFTCAVYELTPQYRRYTCWGALVLPMR